MANKNTFAIACDQEINADIIEKKQVDASLTHKIGTLQKLIFPLFYPNYAVCADTEFGIAKTRTSESSR